MGLTLEMVAALERHAEHVNNCAGLDPRHMLLIQAVRELCLGWRSLDAQLEMAVSRLGGKVEGEPTQRLNFLQRIDELVTKEKPRRGQGFLYCDACGWPNNADGSCSRRECCNAD